MKFKIGDRVSCLGVGASASLVVGDVYTVYSCRGGVLQIEELVHTHPSHSYMPHLFQLVAEERDEVEKALNVMQKHGISRNSLGNVWTRNSGQASDPSVLLDKLFPKKNKELEALKKKADELCKEIEKLEKSL